MVLIKHDIDELSVLWERNKDDSKTDGQYREALDVAIASLEAWQDVLVRIERYADADAYGDYQLGMKCGAEQRT